MTERSACARTRDLIPELAVGVAAPQDRARAFRHMSSCGACHRELESRVAIVDELLLLVQEREPPPGFEASALPPLAGIGSAPRRRRLLPRLLPRLLRLLLRLRPRLRLGPALAWAGSALLVAALVSGLVGDAVWRRTADDRRLAQSYRDTLAVAGGRYLRAAPVISAGTPAGYVFAYQGHPSWVFVILSDAREPGTYRMSLTTRSGGILTLGTMAVREGRGSWGSTVPVPVHDVLMLHFRDPAGRDLAARFT